VVGEAVLGELCLRRRCTWKWLVFVEVSYGGLDRRKTGRKRDC
jgi:hypothetical protein